MRIIYSLIGIALGVLIIKYSIQLTETMGRVEWAERYLRGGLAGTITMYRLVGLIVIILCLLYMFNAYGFILRPLAPLFGGLK